MIAARRYLALAGFLVGGIGAALERPAIVWAAIGVLSTALLLRLIAAFRKAPSAPASDKMSAEQDD